MKNNKLYFPNEDAPIDVFGGFSPCCITMNEIKRLEREFSEPGAPCELVRHFHEATAAEIKEHGINN